MNNKVGVFLSGGGAKGAFEVGAFKAFEEFGVKPDFICGSSVGSMVGSAATYMNSYEMFECWKTLTLESVFNVDSSKLKGLEGKERRMRILKEVLISCFYPEFLIDINRIRNLMYASLNSKRVYDSVIDFGVTATEFPKIKMHKFFKSDMKENDVLEYVLASFYLPLFRHEKILDGKYYVDFGTYRRKPFEMLKEQNCNEIYVIDVSLDSRKIVENAIKKYFDDNYNVNLVYMGNASSMLDFSVETSSSNYNLGYETTIKTLEKKI